MNQVVYEKGLFAAIKGLICLVKEQFDYPEAGEGWIPLTGVVFNTFGSNQEKSFFF